MLKITIVIATSIALLTTLFDSVNSQNCGCNCRRRFNRCSCCRTNTCCLNNNFNVVRSVRICSSTCADLSTSCPFYASLCTNSGFIAYLNATCACTCGFCTTTNACTGLASGANIGPCINNACATGATCNITSQNCLCP